MPLTPLPKVWINGVMVDWDAATHTLHSGTGIYEGLCACATDKGRGRFRHTPHVEGFYLSGQILAACLEATRSAGPDICHVRPLAFYGFGHMGLDTGPCDVDIAIMGWRRASARGEDTNTRGVRMMVSSRWRHDHKNMPPVAKTTGTNVTSSRAKAKAHRAGYHDCILLNAAGMGADCTAENILVMRDGVIHAASQSAGGLEGITQDATRTIAGDLGHEVRASQLTRSDFYPADESFVCGTATEVTSVPSVDGRERTRPGPISAQIQAVFSKAVRGGDPRYAHGLEVA